MIFGENKKRWHQIGSMKKIVQFAQCCANHHSLILDAQMSLILDAQIHSLCCTLLEMSEPINLRIRFGFLICIEIKIVLIK